MQKFLAEDTEKRCLLGAAAGMVDANKRYIFWFYLLNLLLAAFGTTAFVNQAHSILDHSLYSDRLVRGLDVAVLSEFFSRPEFGSVEAPIHDAMHLSFLFFLMTALFLPGVFQGYASTYRLPRDDFFRACGRNLWRFIRLLIVAGIVFGVLAGALFGTREALVKKAGDSTNELLPFEVRVAGIVVIFLVMTLLRIWFDLVEVDVVLSDQRAVRKSIAAGFRHKWRSLGRLLANYVFISVVAAVIVVAGIWSWIKFVPPDNVVRAALLGQVILFLALILRFWQRGVAVAYYLEKMEVPVAVVEPVAPQPVTASAEPLPSPVIPSSPATPSEA
jgi:hypothetical protein